MIMFQVLIFITSVIGAFLVARLSRRSQLIGMWIYLISNLVAILFFIMDAKYVLVAQQLIFASTSVYGIINRSKND